MIYKCPVCLGTGHVREGFYNTIPGVYEPNTGSTTAITNTEPCRSCDGKGVINGTDVVNVPLCQHSDASNPPVTVTYSITTQPQEKVDHDYKNGGWKDKYRIFKNETAGTMYGNFIDEHGVTHEAWKEKIYKPTDPSAIYFVLRLDEDPHARKAALAYADSVEQDNAQLAKEIREKIAMYQATCPRCDGWGVEKPDGWYSICRECEGKGAINTKPESTQE